MAELSLEHASFLAEHLSPHASVWRKLGTALKFRQQDLDNIQGCLPLMNDSPYSYIQRLVEEWLKGKYPHTAPPTLANLLKALNGHTVGLGTLATQIIDSLPQHDPSINAKVFEIASVSDQGDITFNRSEDIRVNENTCVHFKVKGISDTQECEWSNTGLVPIHGKNNTPTLCILKVDIDMDGGQYSCNIKDAAQNCKQDVFYIEMEGNTTTPVTLRVSCPQLDQYKESLASIYLAQPEVPQDSWPPVSNKTYINLALIKQQAINYGGEYARLTIRGDMDDVLHHKEKIEYKNIFDGLRSGSLLLIEGRPGSGKTTFVHKITRDWAENEVQGPMRLVLLVSLRVLNSWKKPVTLKDILQLLDFQDGEKILKGRKGKGVCFIFDGLDEFSPLEGEKSIVHKIINKKYLPKSIVIVASRPAALVKLRQKTDKVIEVIGFPKDQIFEYIKNYPFSNTSKAEELKLYLLSHPNVLHMCYLPIHAAMVAFLFEIMGKVPRTETEIYKHFTRFTLMRSLSKHEGQDEIEDKGQNELEDTDTGKLSREERELFDTICEFALEKTILKKQVLDQSEMKLRLQGKGCKDISLGLVTVDRTAGLYGFKYIYTFLHLTHQEYLAAHHISTLSNEDQHKLIQQYGETDHMQVVWKFYCGLVNFEGHEYKIKALVSGRKRTVLSDIQYAYESQQKVVCDCFMKETDAQIMLQDKYLTTTDFTALGYLLAYNLNPISLSLTNCNMNIEAVSALLKETEGKPLCLCTLSYESQDIDLESLTKLLSKQYSLERLNITNTSKTSTSHSTAQFDFNYSSKTSHPTLSLSNLVSTSLANLKELSLKNVNVDLYTLLRVLQCCKKLISLTLNDIFKKDDNTEPLLKEASRCQKLEIMSCSFTSTSDNFLCSISITRTETNSPPAIQDASMLHVQGVRGDYFQTLRVDRICNCDLKSFNKYNWPPRPKLLVLHQVSCNIFPTIFVSDFSALEKLIVRQTLIDATLLTKILSCCVMLQELDLSQGQIINPEVFTTVLTSLKNCSNLQKLVLNHLDIKTDDACVLASCLEHWPKLQELHLRKCGIEEEGAKAIADNRSHCLELEVDLSENNVSYETLEMIKSSSLSHFEMTESSLQSHNTCCCTLF